MLIQENASTADDQRRQRDLYTGRSLMSEKRTRRRYDGIAIFQTRLPGSGDAEFHFQVLEKTKRVVAGSIRSGGGRNEEIRRETVLWWSTLVVVSAITDDDEFFVNLTATAKDINYTHRPGLDVLKLVDFEMRLLSPRRKPSVR